MTGTPKNIVLTPDGNAVQTGTVRALSEETFRQPHTGTRASWLRKVGGIGRERERPAFAHDSVKVVKNPTCNACLMGHPDGYCPLSDRHQGPPVEGALLPAAVVEPPRRVEAQEPGQQTEKRGRQLAAEEGHEETDGKKQRVQAVELLRDDENEVHAVEMPEKDVGYHSDARWKEAMDKEMTSFEKYDVYDWVEEDDVPAGKRVIGGRWVHALKNYDLLYYDKGAAVTNGRAVHKSRYDA